MEHKVWYDKNDEIINLELIGIYHEADVFLIEKEVVKLLEGKPVRQMLIDINNTQKVENRKTRELANQSLKDTSITEAAFVGGTAANRMIAKVLLKTGALDTKGDFFKNREEAIKWLKSKR